MPKYIGKNILNHDLIVRRGDVSGSASSTGSFGRVEGNTVLTAPNVSSPLITQQNSIGGNINLPDGSVSLTIGDSVSIETGYTVDVDDGAQWIVVPPSFFII